MDNRYHIITRKQISCSDLYLRAPKYVHRLGTPEASGRFLRAFKAVKILTCIPDRMCRDRRHFQKCVCRFRKREACIREVLFKHSKTCRKRYNAFNLDFIESDRYKRYNYKHWQDSLTKRFYYRQIAWDEYSLSVFSRHDQLWKDFLTKRSIQNLFVDLTLFYGESLTLDVSRLVRHLTALKGLEILDLRISSFYYKEQTYKFFKVFNNISHLMSPETKIRLILSFLYESDNWNDMYFQMLRSSPNILQRITHLKIRFNQIETGFKSFVDFTGTCFFSRLRSFDLDIHQMDHFGENAIEYLFDSLATNVNLQTLRISSPMRWYPGLVTKIMDLAKYKNFLSRLEGLSIDLPTLAFKNFNLKLLNQDIKAKQVEIIRNIRHGDGFIFFISKFEPETETTESESESSVFVEIKDHTLFVDIKHFQVIEQKVVANWDCGMINRQPRLNNTALQSGRDLSQLAMSRVWEFILKIGFRLSKEYFYWIQSLLENFANTLQMLIIRYEGHDRFWKEDNQYKISSLNYLDRKENRMHNKLYEEYIYEVESEEDKNYDEEMLQISYLENRDRPIERKNNRKIFVE